ncbi:MAG: hypothetical protein ACFB10_20610 [Salibacteraceae bacterium]
MSSTRAERRAKFKELIELASTTPDPPDNFGDSDFAERFDKYWPVLRQALDYAIALKVTGKKTDAKLGALVTIGDNIVGNSATDADKEHFISTMKKIWGITSRILNMVTVFTDDKTDKVIDKIISIGDWITGGDNQEDDDDEADNASAPDTPPAS